MKRTWLIAVALVAVVAVAGLTGCGTGGATFSGDTGVLKVNLTGQQEGIWISGNGQVSAAPDMATVRLGIEAQEMSVAAAQNAAAEAMARVQAALEDNGIDEKDIQTQQFSIRKITRWDEGAQREVVIGYRVTNTVSAKVRDIEQVGVVVDAVALAGGDLTRIDGISFSIEDPAELQREARDKAVADARDKAEQLAGAAGVNLGEPVYITENSYIPSPVFRADAVLEAAGAPMETPISPGELDINVTVQVAYAID